MLSYIFIITGKYYNYYFICKIFHFKQENTNYLIISRAPERMSYINMILNTGKVKEFDLNKNILFNEKVHYIYYK